MFLSRKTVLEERFSIRYDFFFLSRWYLEMSKGVLAIKSGADVLLGIIEWI